MGKQIKTKGIDNKSLRSYLQAFDVNTAKTAVHRNLQAGATLNISAKSDPLYVAKVVSITPDTDGWQRITLLYINKPDPQPWSVLYKVVGDETTPAPQEDEEPTPNPTPAQQAEDARQRAAQAQQQAEQSRQQAEQSRQAAEDAQRAAEDAQRQAEQSRQQAMQSGDVSDMQQAIQDQRQAEDAQRTAEDAQRQAEDAQQQAEQAQQQAEQAQQQAEQAQRQADEQPTPAPAPDEPKKPHPQLKTVLQILATGEHVYLYGPAGTGKSTLAEQAAQALSADYHPLACLCSKLELDGFTDAGGTYRETEFYRAVTQGGLLFIDEIDNNPTEVNKALNGLLASGYYTFPAPIGLVKAHPDLLVLAAANTKGNGASDAFGASATLDQSTRDRYTFVNIPYNRKIELQCANGDRDLVEFAHDLRKAVEQLQLPYQISYRGIKRAAKFLAATRDPQFAILTAFVSSWEDEDTPTIAAAIKESDNPYTQILKSMI